MLVLAALALKLLLLKVVPLQAFAPATLNIRIQVEPQAENRLVRVIVDDGENFFRSTDIDLEGAAAPKTQRPIEYKMVPPGNYLVKVFLFDSAGHVVTTAQQVVLVIGM